MYGSYGLLICMNIRIIIPYGSYGLTNPYDHTDCWSYVHTDFRRTSSSFLAMNSNPTSPYTLNEARTPPKTKYASKMTLTEATSTIGVGFCGNKKALHKWKIGYAIYNQGYFWHVRKLLDARSSCPNFFDPCDVQNKQSI